MTSSVFYSSHEVNILLVQTVTSGFTKVFLLNGDVDEMGSEIPTSKILNSGNLDFLETKEVQFANL